MSSVLAGGDFLRAPVLATARPEGFKEWHHFVVHGRGFRLLINFSLNNEMFGAGHARLAPRVIVIAHDDRWTGAIERFDGHALDVSADLGELTIGGNRMTVATRRLPRGNRPARQGHSRRTGLHLGESALRGQQPTGGRRSDVLALRTEAARPGMATDRRPGTPHRERPRLSRPQLGPVLVGRRLRLDMGHPFTHETRRPVVDGVPADDRPRPAALSVPSALRVARR